MTCGFAPACAKRGVLETSHGFWLAKEKQGSKIDSAGALSFACVCGWAGWESRLVRRSLEGQSRSRLNFDPLARKKFDQLALNENGFGAQK